MKSTLYTYNNSGLFSTFISQKRTLYKFKEFFCNTYYHLIIRDGERIPIPLEDLEEKYSGTFESVIEFIKDNRKVDIISTRFVFSRRTIIFDGEEFVYRNKKLSENELLNEIKSINTETAIIEHISSAKYANDNANEITIIVLNHAGDEPFVAEAYLKLAKKNKYKKTAVDVETGENGIFYIAPATWQKVCELVIDITRYLSGFDILRVDIELIGNRIVIRKVTPRLSIYDEKDCSKVVSDFINNWNREQNTLSITRKTQKEQDALFKEKWKGEVEKHHLKGMRPYMAYLYDKELTVDKRDTETSAEEKQWAWDRGFFSYRIRELGLDEENYREYVSDYEYFWVNRINNDYQCWVQDKLAMRYVLEKQKELLPDYYYVVRNINGIRRINMLPDLPPDYDCQIESLRDLIDEKKVLAVKRTQGVHGDGFIKLEAFGDKVKVNGLIMTLEDAIPVVFPEETIMVITEYVKMHPFLERVFSESLNTIRVNCFSDLGCKPQIGACFAKFGHAKGGYTDNINTDAGGIVAELDKTNGRILKSEFKRGNNYYPCDIHPDTGIPIKGTIPFWDDIIRIVKEIAIDMSQLQYFGFDIAVTKDGPKIIEINVFPDYTKYILHDRPTQLFLRKKVLEKRISQNLPIEMDYGEKKLFDVIIPAYNTEEYIDECIQSLISQTIGFKEHIKLIIVDDGSTDSTYRICMKYCKAYPENIICIKTDNQGVSKSRNVGLKESKAKYVTFCDSDDYWEKDAFEKVAMFFEMHGNECDVVDCRAKWFEMRSGYLQHDHKFNKGTRVIDIFDEPNAIQLAVNTAFFRGDKAREHSFNESITIGEDSRYVNEIILEKEKYGVIKEAVYHRRVRKSKTNLTQIANLQKAESVYINTPRLYYQYMYDLSNRIYGRIIPYIQYLIMDAVRYRMSIEIPNTLSDRAKESYRNIILGLIKDTNPEVLFNLKNGSVSQRARVIKYRLENADEINFEFINSYIFINGKNIGKFHVRNVCKIREISRKKSVVKICGEIVIPWYIHEFKVSCESETTGLVDLPLKKKSVSKVDMMGENIVSAYDFEFENHINKVEKIIFWMQLQGERIQLEPNINKIKLDNINAKQVENALLMCYTSRVIKKVIKKIKNKMNHTRYFFRKYR